MGPTNSQQTSSRYQELNNNDIDNIWRLYKCKAEEHYGSNLRSFSVVMISKLDPRAIKFVQSQVKKNEDKWDSIFQNQHEETGKPAPKKKKRIGRRMEKT